MLAVITKITVGLAITVATALTPLGCNNPQPPKPYIYGAAAWCAGYDYDFENFPAGKDVVIYSTLVQVLPNGAEGILLHFADHTQGRTHYINIHDVAPFFGSGQSYHAELDLTWSVDGQTTTNASFDGPVVPCDQ